MRRGRHQRLGLEFSRGAAAAAASSSAFIARSSSRLASLNAANDDGGAGRTSRRERGLRAGLGCGRSALTVSTRWRGWSGGAEGSVPELRPVDVDEDVRDGGGDAGRGGLLARSRAFPAAFGRGFASGEAAGVTFSRLYRTTSLGRASGEARARGGFGEVGRGDAAALARRAVRTPSGGSAGASSEGGASRGERRGGVAADARRSGPGVLSAMRSSVNARSSTAALVPGVIPGLASSASSSGPRWLRRSIATRPEHRSVRPGARWGMPRGTRKQRLFREKTETETDSAVGRTSSSARLTRLTLRVPTLPRDLDARGAAPRRAVGRVAARVPPPQASLALGALARVVGRLQHGWWRRGMLARLRKDHRLSGGGREETLVADIERRAEASPARTVTSTGSRPPPRPPTRPATGAISARRVASSRRTARSPPGSATRPPSSISSASTTGANPSREPSSRRASQPPRPLPRSDPSSSAWSARWRTTTATGVVLATHRGLRRPRPRRPLRHPSRRGDLRRSGRPPRRPLRNLTGEDRTDDSEVLFEMTTPRCLYVDLSEGKARRRWPPHVLLGGRRGVVRRGTDDGTRSACDGSGR